MKQRDCFFLFFGFILGCTVGFFIGILPNLQSPTMQPTSMTSVHKTQQGTFHVPDEKTLLEKWKNNPTDSHLLYALGHYYYINNEYEKAISFLSPLTNHIDAQLKLAFSYQKLNKKTDSLNIYKKILQTHPNSLQALRYAAQLYEELNQKQNAIECYEKMQSLVPHQQHELIFQKKIQEIKKQ